MAKAIACVGGTQVSNSVARIGYTVSVLDTVSFSYGADYQVDTGIGIAANLTAWKNKIIAEVATKGTTLLITDVIVFGAPS